MKVIELIYYIIITELGGLMSSLELKISNVGKRYKVVSTEEKKEMRKKYEWGFSLKEIAYDHKVNYGTLKNVAAKEKWVKGKTKQLCHDLEVQQDLESNLKEIDEIKSHYKNLHKSNLAYLIELERTKKRPLDKSEEDALKTRIISVKESYLLAERLYSILTASERTDHESRMLKLEENKLRLELLEEYEDEKIKIEIETKRLELKEKELELKLKELNAEHYLKKRK